MLTLDWLTDCAAFYTVRLLGFNTGFTLDVWQVKPLAVCPPLYLLSTAFSVCECVCVCVCVRVCVCVCARMHAAFHSYLLLLVNAFIKVWFIHAASWFVILGCNNILHDLPNDTMNKSLSLCPLSTRYQWKKVRSKFCVLLEFVWSNLGVSLE